jgi:uncharacterized protein YjbI with pentapeptide repeats
MSSKIWRKYHDYFNRFFQPKDLSGRDFRKERDLRNRSFRKAILTGADFSGCDLRGADFTRATLERVKFVGITTGLTRWQIFKLILWDGMFIIILSSPCILPFAILFALGSLFNFVNSGVNITTVTTLAWAFLAIIISLIGSIILFKASVFGGPRRWLLLGNLTTGFLCAGITSGFAFATFTSFKEAGGNSLIILACIFLFCICFSLKFIWHGIDDIKKHPGTTFRTANLAGADFKKAKLDNCNFRGAIFDQVNWSGAVINKNCLFTRERSHIYHRPDALLVDRQGRGDYQHKNLSRQDLSHINFKESDLSNANLNESILESADLSDAILTNVQANGTNFSNANLTGACIQNWWINAATRFDNVTCKYIYLNSARLVVQKTF